MQHTRALLVFGLILLMGLGCPGLASDARADVVNEDAKMMPSDGADGDQFGFSIDFDGTHIAAGARLHNGEQGAAYVFGSDGMGGYTQIKKLVPSDVATGDQVGSAVLVSGDLAFVGGYMADVDTGLDVVADAGAVWMFSRNEGGADNWGEVGKLVADVPVAGAGFGSSLAKQGDWLVVGAQNEPIGTEDAYAGAAYMFGPDGMGGWVQTQRLQASDYDYKDYFGQSCGIDGDTLAIGAHQGNKAYVFENDGFGTWVEQKILTAAGSSYMGTGTTIQGDTIVVGAYQTAVGGFNKAGTAYVFERDQGGADNWGQVAELAATDGPQSSAYFGIDTAIDGDKIVVGAHGQDGQGAAYVFGKTGGVWVAAGKLVASDGATGDYFGYRDALVGDTAVVAAIKALGGEFGIDSIGAAYTFTTPDPNPLVPGDATGEGQVTEADAQILAENWGEGTPETPATWSQGNFDGDDVVGPKDAAIMAANWGYGVTEAGAVPEPAAVVLLAGIFLAALLRRGRRR